MVTRGITKTILIFGGLSVAILMFFMVFFIGAVVNVISALVLKREPGSKQ